MDADTELNTALGWETGIAFDHAVLHLDRTPHGINHASELNKTAIAHAFHHTPVMHSDGGID